MALTFFAAVAGIFTLAFWLVKRADSRRSPSTDPRLEVLRKRSWSTVAAEFDSSQE